MKNFKSIKVTILCFMFLILLVSAFSKNNASTFIVTDNNPFFPNDQTVTGPGFFPFSNSQGVIDLFNQQCPDPTFLFDGPDSLFGSTLEVGPAANNAETGSRDILVFNMDGDVLIAFDAFPLVDPFTMAAFDPSMGDILGLSLVPGTGFPPSSTFMITTTFNCDDGMSTSTSSTSTSSTSSSSSSTSSSSTSSGGSSSGGISFTPVQNIVFAITNEHSAKGSIDLKDLIRDVEVTFSVSDAIDGLKNSIKELMTLQTQVDTTIMIGMSNIQNTLNDAINNDTEAIMLLEPFKNTDPSLTDKEFTTAITKAKKLINEAMRAKELIKGKLTKLEKKDK